MNWNLQLIPGALAATGAVFFFVYWVGINLAFRRLNPVERAEMIRRISMTTDRQDLRTRFRRWARSFTGYKGSGSVLAYGWMIATAATYALTMAAGMGPIQGLAAALPVSVVVLAILARRGVRRQRLAFERQLMTSMSLIASQLEAGGGFKRSLERVIEVVEDPLRSEFDAMLRKVETGYSMVDAVRDLAEEYPTSAMQLFVAALEADEQSPGGKLAPVLRAIAESLERTFELRSEAEAEIAQSRAQFYGIVAGLVVIGFLMFNMGGPENKEMYFSPLGLLVMVPVLLNAVWGVLRVRKLFNAAAGGLK